MLYSPIMGRPQLLSKMLSATLNKENNGNLYHIKKSLFFIPMSGYNNNVGDRMLPEIGKDAEKEGGHAGGPLFLFPFLKPLFIDVWRVC